MRKHEASARSFGRKVLCSAATMSLIFAYGAPISYADDGSKWVAPTSAVSVDDNVVTIGSQASGNVVGEMLGLNGTVLSTIQIDPKSLDEANNSDRLGVYGSDANVKANPYLANEYYNFYATSRGLEASDFAVAKQTQTSLSATNFSISKESLYGTVGSLYYRPDIVTGIDGAPGSVGNLTVNRTSTSAKNVGTWDSSGGSVSQPYKAVLEIRTFTNNDAVVGTNNSDGNSYTKSDYYKTGDETYDPIGVRYLTASGMASLVEDSNVVASAARIVMEQQGKTTRYGDPVQIANEYEKYVKASKWLVLSKIADGTVKKKKVAVVYGMTGDSFKLVTLNGTGESGSMGTMRVAEAAEETVEDLAKIINPNLNAGSTRARATASQLAEADLIVCIPNDDSSSFGASQVKDAFNTAGVTCPNVIDNVFPNGTFENSVQFGNSVESGMLAGIVQGLVYPEVLNPLDMAGYYFSKFFHLKDSEIVKYMSTELSGMSLPGGLELGSYTFDAETVSRVQNLLDAGTEYYYKNKESLDKDYPLITSSSTLDTAVSHGVHEVSVTVPNGASFTLIDSNCMPVTSLSSGKYQLVESETYTLRVVRSGYKSYTQKLTGTSKDILVTSPMMTKVAAESDTAAEKDKPAKVVKTVTVNAKTVTAKAVASAVKKAGARRPPSPPSPWAPRSRPSTRAPLSPTRS